MKCKCGKVLISDGLNGMCWECYYREPIKNDNYCRTEKMHTGWECPKCGYVWAIWVDGCANCNQPILKIKTIDGGGTYANQIKP